MTERERFERSPDGISTCPCCGGEAAVDRHSKIFNGQTYSDRYPPDVARQNHGFQVRCQSCGLQTCWWHYESEAIDAWNKRQASASIEELEAENAALVEALRTKDSCARQCEGAAYREEAKRLKLENAALVEALRAALREGHMPDSIKQMGYAVIARAESAKGDGDD